MVDNNIDEINKVESSIRSTEREISDVNMSIREIDKKLDKLIPAEKELSEEKYYIRENFNKMREISEEKLIWIGDTKELFDKLYGNNFSESCFRYMSELDNVHDELNDEITRLENFKYEQNGLLGHLRSKLNSLGNTLSNLLN